MWVGFHDDPSFRWEGDRDVTLNRARGANATMVRAVVTWASVAPTRPASAADPFDPVYKLDDLDELVRDTQQRGMEVLLTIWGTPKWANGEQGAERPPEADGRSDRLRPRARLPLFRPLPGISVRALLVGVE